MNSIANITGESPRLSCQNISVTIGSATLLRGVDFEAAPGEFIAVVGPNGAGKSTFLSVLSGDRQPSTGKVLMDGQTIDSLSVKQLARFRSVLPQQTKTLFSFTAKDVVMMGRFNSDDGLDDVDVATQMMDATRVGMLASRSYPSLSGGEQALVNLARVLAQRTPVLMLDEPTAALDVAHQEHVCSIARSAADDGKTIVAVLHDLNLASRYADRIVVMSAGTIVADAPPIEALNALLLCEVYGTSLAVIEHPFHANIPLVLSITGATHVSA
jgi:iron complex transport system ATP-binding protein